jgi:tripartite-type tricarboxylate transporter receptor subunit TctC
MTLSRQLMVLAGLCALTLGSAAAQTVAQDAARDFPNRPLRIVVPFPAGGPSDVLARMIGQKLSEEWSQPVVIENRVGANTVIGAQAVRQAPGDGYTLLMAIDSTLTMNQYLYRTPPYDPFNDFVPITLVAKTMVLMIVNSTSEVKSVSELIAKARQQPGKLNFGAGTISTRLLGHLVNKAAGIDTVLVPYNGSAEVTQGLLTKSVDFTLDGTSAAASLIQSGQFRVLGKFDDRPFPLAPTAPMVQATVTNLDQITVWLGLVAPKGTSPAIVAKLQQGVVKALADPTIKARADAAGLFPATSTPPEFADFIKTEAARWSKVVADSGMKYD